MNEQRMLYVHYNVLLECAKLFQSAIPELMKIQWKFVVILKTQENNKIKLKIGSNKRIFEQKKND